MGDGQMGGSLRQRTLVEQREGVDRGQVDGGRGEQAPLIGRSPVLHVSLFCLVDGVITPPTKKT